MSRGGSRRRGEVGRVCGCVGCEGTTGLLLEDRVINHVNVSCPSERN